MDLFKELLPSITTRKTHLLETMGSEKEYVPFVVNKALSAYIDCILHTNAINRFPSLDKKLQYDYYFHAIQAKKRPFVPWNKKEVKSEDLEAIQTFYSFSATKANEALKLLSEDQLKTIREKTKIGGIKKR